MLCTGAPLFLVVLQTDQKKNPLSLPARVLHFSWGIFNILPVYVLNIKLVELRARGQHFKAELAFCWGWQNSQMAPTGQRTIPAADAPKATGLERSFLLPFLSSNLHPIIPSHLHLREMEKKMKKGGKKESHWFSCTPAPRRLFSFRFPCASTYETFTPSFINTHADVCLRTNIYEWLLRS